MKSFSKPANLKRHQLTHSGIVDLFKCSMCEKGFTRPDVRDKHLLSVHGLVKEQVAKAFPCVHGSCDRTFTEKRNMMKHIREFHDGLVEEVQCDLENLQVDDDENASSAAKRVKLECSHCKSTFSKKFNLDRHIRTKHADLVPPTSESGFSIDCPECAGRTFTKLHLLGDHLQAEHGYVDESKTFEFSSMEGKSHRKLSLKYFQFPLLIHQTVTDIYFCFFSFRFPVVEGRHAKRRSVFLCEAHWSQICQGRKAFLLCVPSQWAFPF